MSLRLLSYPEFEQSLRESGMDKTPQGGVTQTIWVNPKNGKYVPVMNDNGMPVRLFILDDVLHKAGIKSDFTMSGPKFLNKKNFIVESVDGTSISDPNTKIN